MAKPPDNIRKLPTGVKTQHLPKPPENLSKTAKEWWKKLVGEYAIDDQYGLMLLQTALEAHDRMNEAAAILNKEGLTVMDRYGQHKQHPAAAIERDQRAQMLAALKQLNLDIEPLGKAGRPAKS